MDLVIAGLIALTIAWFVPGLRRRYDERKAAGKEFRALMEKGAKISLPLSTFLLVRAAQLERFMLGAFVGALATAVMHLTAADPVASVTFLALSGIFFVLTAFTANLWHRFYRVPDLTLHEMIVLALHLEDLPVGEDKEEEDGDAPEE